MVNSKKRKMISLGLVFVIIFLLFKSGLLTAYERDKIIAKFRKNSYWVVIVILIVGSISTYFSVKRFYYGIDFHYTEKDISWLWKFLDISVKYTGSHIWDSSWLLLWLGVTAISSYFFKIKVSTDNKRKSYLYFFVPILILSMIMLIIGGLLYASLLSVLLWGIVWFAVYVLHATTEEIK